MARNELDMRFVIGLIKTSSGPAHARKHKRERGREVARARAQAGTMPDPLMLDALEKVKSANEVKALHQLFLRLMGHDETERFPGSQVRAAAHAAPTRTLVSLACARESGQPGSHARTFRIRSYAASCTSGGRVNRA